MSIVTKYDSGFKRPSKGRIGIVYRDWDSELVEGTLVPKLERGPLSRLGFNWRKATDVDSDAGEDTGEDTGEDAGDGKTHTKPDEVELKGSCSGCILTLDEAIEHALEVANQNDGPCAVNHARLAEWLEELRTYRASSSRLSAGTVAGGTGESPGAPPPSPGNIEEGSEK